MTPTLLNDVSDWPTVLSALLTLLVVRGLVWAIFWSLPGASLRRALSRRRARIQSDMRLARWEIANMRQYVAGTSKDKAPRLEPFAIRKREGQVARWEPQARWLSRLLYPLECLLCQTFWVAFAWLWVAHGLSWEVALSAVGYAGATELLSQLLQRGARVPAAPPSIPRPQQGGCGGQKES